MRAEHMKRSLSKLRMARRAPVPGRSNGRSRKRMRFDSVFFSGKVAVPGDGHSPGKTVRGEHVQFEGEDFYRISNYDRMRPFFMTAVSDADHWMFISSNGGLTAGRRTADLALFPYYTDDKIRDMAEATGS